MRKAAKREVRRFDSDASKSGVRNSVIEFQLPTAGTSHKCPDVA